MDEVVWEHSVFNYDRTWFLKNYFTDLVTPTDLSYGEAWGGYNSDDDWY